MQKKCYKTYKCKSHIKIKQFDKSETLNMFSANACMSFVYFLKLKKKLLPSNFNQNLKFEKLAVLCNLYKKIYIHNLIILSYSYR